MTARGCVVLVLLVAACSGKARDAKSPSRDHKNLDDWYCFENDRISTDSFCELTPQQCNAEEKLARQHYASVEPEVPFESTGCAASSAPFCFIYRDKDPNYERWACYMHLSKCEKMQAYYGPRVIQGCERAAKFPYIALGKIPRQH